LTGEVWFEPVDGILTKFLFTEQKLSVQVHPGGSAGKTEMWHILRAEPGASIALGFREPAPPRERIREACLSGEILDLLRWVPVAPGETYFIPAGTVHALGEGIALCEIQQNNDVTYRLYDYGRPRELHLDQGLAVIDATPHPGAASFPIACDYFVTDCVRIPAGGAVVALAPALQAAVVAGAGTWEDQAYRAGEVWSLPGGARVTAREDTVLLTVQPGR
jgi:mannose-6-phosphate isomerase